MALLKPGPSQKPLTSRLRLRNVGSCARQSACCEPGLGLGSCLLQPAVTIQPTSVLANTGGFRFGGRGLDGRAAVS
jgi:hypothetical protein